MSELTIDNDLAVKTSRLIEEWDVILNECLPPHNLQAISTKSAWWRCGKCGYSWERTIGKRLRSIGCPVCSGQAVWIGHNDFLTVHPEIAADWDYDQNQSLLPEQFRAGSNKKVWWKCSTCFFKWQATIVSRSEGRGCSKCSRRRSSSIQRLRLVNERGSLQFTDPQVARQWDYEKNGGLMPTQVTRGSKVKAWWICD